MGTLARNELKEKKTFVKRFGTFLNVSEYTSGIPEVNSETFIMSDAYVF